MRLMQKAKIKRFDGGRGELETTISNRADELSQWLVQNAHWCLESESDLAGHPAERVYWHHGYMVALRDILQLMRSITCSLH